MKIHFTILLLLIPFLSNAQLINKLKQDASIEWILETEYEYILENKKQLDFCGEIVRTNFDTTAFCTETIKIDRFSGCFDSPFLFLTKTILDEFKNGNIEARDYEDPSKKISYEDLKESAAITDTIVAFDPVKNKKYYHVIFRDPFKLIHSFKVKQVWFLNKKTGQISNYVTEVIPLMWVEFNKEQYRKKELCRLLMNNKPQTILPDINNSNFIWIKGSSDKVDLRYSKFKKGRFENALVKRLWDKPFDGEAQVVKTEGPLFCAPELSEKELEQMMSASTDTVAIFDPTTFEEHIEVVHHAALNLGDFQGESLQQIWYYDSKHKSLNSYLAGIGPFIERRNTLDNKKIHSRFTLFFLRF